VTEKVVIYMTQSICSFAWALTLFTGRELFSLASEPLRPLDDLAILLGTLAEGMAGLLGPLGQTAYRAGDNFQRSMTESVFGNTSDNPEPGSGWGRVIHDETDN
jgi:hypothetical protein